MIQRRFSSAIAAAGIVAVLGTASVVPAFGQDRIDRLEREIEDSKNERNRLDNSLSDLTDEKGNLDSKRGDLNASLEGLDEDIAAKVTELQDLQDELPAAQQAVDDAEARVAAAQQEVSSLNTRVADAESRLADIQQEIAEAQEALDLAQDEVGQIAADAYKSGGSQRPVLLIRRLRLVVARGHGHGTTSIANPRKPNRRRFAAECRRHECPSTLGGCRSGDPRVEGAS